ncbi:hypothetical protein G7Z17_g1970 [Cylindrodendrum hubeiense]|uniref:Uncharacterized protein n=1 Tax=Cylindrodendrum hubeiense TaxID=595255 RepID=A0A9P5HIM8_9HYPO|nr:hypothetical protein G7Z17_g1970 [Cylindrodendrum hubeiense]
MDSSKHFDHDSRNYHQTMQTNMAHPTRRRPPNTPTYNTIIENERVRAEYSNQRQLQRAPQPTRDIFTERRDPLDSSLPDPRMPSKKTGNYKHHAEEDDWDSPNHSPNHHRLSEIANRDESGSQEEDWGPPRIINAERPLQARTVPIWVNPENPQDNTVHMSLNTRDYLEDYLEKLSRLGRLGRLSAAFDQLGDQLRPFFYNRYVLVQYGQLLLDGMRYKELAELAKLHPPRPSNDPIDLNWNMILVRAQYASELDFGDISAAAISLAAKNLVQQSWPQLDSTESRPYLRFLMAEVLFAGYGDPDEWMETVHFNGVNHGTLFRCEGVFPDPTWPMYEPDDDEVPEWQPKPNATKKHLSQTIRLVLKASEELGDIRMQAGCLEQLVNHGAEDAGTTMAQLSDLFHTVGNKRHHRSMLLSRYLVANSPSKRLQLREEILLAGPYLYSVQLNIEYLERTRLMILAALAGTKRERQFYQDLVDTDLDSEAWSDSEDDVYDQAQEENNGEEIFTKVKSKAKQETKQFKPKGTDTRSNENVHDWDEPSQNGPKSVSHKLVKHESSIVYSGKEQEHGPEQTVDPRVEDRPARESEKQTRETEELATDPAEEAEATAEGEESANLLTKKAKRGGSLLGRHTGRLNLLQESVANKNDEPSLREVRGKATKEVVAAKANAVEATAPEASLNSSHE